MAGEIFMSKMASIVSGFALLAGLFSVSGHSLTMQPMQMDGKATALTAASQNNTAPANMDDRSTGPCCDAIGSFFLACAFVAPELRWVALDGDSQRVVHPAPPAQSIYLEAVTPPPKI